MVNKDFFDDINKFVETNIQEYKDLIKTITSIPAPSHKEHKRAKFLQDYISDMGLEARIDDVQNVVIDEFVNIDKRDDIYLYMAHIDTVFPDETTIDVIEEDGLIKAPGVGDDTTNVAAILMCLKFIKENQLKPKRSVLFALNSCEEGLGNLKGAIKLMEDYGSRVKQVISFDCGYDGICNKAVGSKRFKVTVSTGGGHSYYDYGNSNAIEILAKLIEQIYCVDVSDLPGKSTYNVGNISGGTSINTIAQNATILFEFRADSNKCLEILDGIFGSLIVDFRKKYCGSAEIEVEILGERPSEKDLDEEKQQRLSEMSKEIIKIATGEDVGFSSGSTDCNVPLSMGIPAVSYGTYLGGGIHTREEYIEVESLAPGLKVAMITILQEYCRNM